MNLIYLNFEIFITFLKDIFCNSFEKLISKLLKEYLK